MTLRLLRNLRITRLSRQVWTASLSLAGLAALCAGTADAQRPGQRYLLSFEDNRPRIQMLSGEQRAKDSSLERLKKRSAQDRFERIQSASPAPEPLPLLEPAESTPVPVAPPPPAKNRLPRLPDADELEGIDPFGETRQKLQTINPERAIPPTPAENKLPQLPDLEDLEEFDPFVESQRKLQAVQPRRNGSLPSPVPAPGSAPTDPVFSTFQAQQPEEYPTPKPPEIVRSLSKIQPTYDYQFTVEDDFLRETRGEEPDRVPVDAEFPDGVYQERLSPDSLFAWEASNLYHNPLYFEDPTLERYGHVHPCVQPLVSLTRIGVQLVGMPYQSVIDTPWTKRYTLGWYRPGEPAPHLCYQVPLNPEAAAAEALGITAGFLIIP